MRLFAVFAFGLVMLLGCGDDTKAPVADAKVPVAEKGIVKEAAVVKEASSPALEASVVKESSTPAVDAKLPTH